MRALSRDLVRRLFTGEEAIEELLEVARLTGVAVFNIIPDRNYTPGSPIKN